MNIGYRKIAYKKNIAYKKIRMSKARKRGSAEKKGCKPGFFVRHYVALLHLEKHQLQPALKAFAFLFLMLMLGLSLESYGVSAYKLKGGDIFLVRPHNSYIDYSYVPSEYLSVEDLVFITCIEDENTPVISSVICLDDTSFEDIAMQRWHSIKGYQSCYIGSFNLDEKACSDMVLQSEYLKDDETVTIQKKLKVNRLTSVLDIVEQTQYSDGGWRNAVETAGGIWVLSNYPAIYSDEIGLGIDWLKMHRDNDNKCWPDEDCSVRTTAKILAYLSLSNITESRRVMHDGIVYLEKMQNYYEDSDEWRLNVSSIETGTTNCLITYNYSHLNNENFSISENSSKAYTLDPSENKKLYVICDHNIRAELYTESNETVFVYEGDNMTYTMPWNCWSNDAKWGACDIKATLFALLTNISSDNKERAFSYIQSLLHQDREGEMYVGNSSNETVKIENTALYLLAREKLNSLDSRGVIDIDSNATGVDETIAWLRYKQNNNGSWGSYGINYNIYPTGYSILALSEAGFNRTHEVIKDAETWVVDAELSFLENVSAEYLAWNNTEKDALAFIVLKNNARPLLKTTPRVVVLDKSSLVLQVFNPTTFKLTSMSANLSESLSDIVEVEQPEQLNAYSYMKLTLKRKKSDTGTVYGYLSINNMGQELTKVPIIVTSYPKLNITAQKSLKVFGTTARLSFDVVKSKHKFKCSVKWLDNDISSKKELLITGSKATLDLSFSKPERVEKTYKAILSCEAIGTDGTFEIPVSVDISRYPSFPFEIMQKSLYLNSSKPGSYFIVKNKLDETIDLEIKFDKKQPYLELSDNSLALDPNADANISISSNVPGNVNYSSKLKVTVTALGQSRKVSVIASFMAAPKKKMPAWLLYLLVAVALSALAAGGYYGYLHFDDLKALLTRAKKQDDALIRIKKLEEKEKNTAIINMVRIMRMLNKNDEEIKKRLIAEGFSDSEIEKAMSEEFE